MAAIDDGAQCEGPKYKDPVSKNPEWLGKDALGDFRNAELGKGLAGGTSCPACGYCPHCGYCPTCGRPNNWNVPYMPVYPSPFWQVTCANTTHFDTRPPNV